MTSANMSSEHIVVDGSNIATEGRSAPSLAQLEEAVGELRREYPEAEITVIVDATFSHRIDASELERFEKAALEGEYVHPPAGAIGRGDAFLLRIAEKVDAIVLSNDSFQEFHGEHPWLFERGRLLGATPVPGVGWIFTPRTPVRGPKSHRAVRDTDRAKKKVSRAIEAATKEAVSPPSAASPREPATKRAGKRVAAKADAPAAAGAPRRRQEKSNPAAAAVNDPLTFVSFIAEHPLGTEVTGRVDGYTSHGAVVFVGEAQCYVPLANMAAPPPRSAREILKRDEERTFVVTALDPLRRGVELALPGIAVVSGRPSQAMIEAEVSLVKKAASPSKRTAKKAPAKKAAAPARAAKKTVAEAELVAAAAPAAAPEKPPAARRSPRSLAQKAAAPARKAAQKAGTPAAPKKVGAVQAGQPRRKAAVAVTASAPARKSPRASKKAPAPAKNAVAGASKVAARRGAERPRKTTKSS